LLLQLPGQESCIELLHVDHRWFPCIRCFKQAVADLGSVIGCLPPTTRAGPQESGTADRESAGPLSVWSFTEPGRHGQERLAAVGLPSNGADERTRGCCPCLLGWPNQRRAFAVVPHLEEPESSLKHHSTHSAIIAALVDPSHLRSLTFANYRCPDFGAARLWSTFFVIAIPSIPKPISIAVRNCDQPTAFFFSSFVFFVLRLRSRLYPKVCAAVNSDYFLAQRLCAYSNGQQQSHRKKQQTKLH
jgi:hypothetical protein